MNHPRAIRTQDGPEPTKIELSTASYATLNWHAATDAAKTLINKITNDVATWEIKSAHRKHKRDKTSRSLRMAVEGFVADLLRAQEPSRVSHWVYRSTHPRGFVGERVSANAFKSVLAALDHNGFVETKKAFTQFGELGDRHHAPRFRATKRLLDFAEPFGILVKNAEDHFAEGQPERPLVLKATNKSQGANRERGRKLPIPDNARVRALQDQVKRLNEFIGRFVLDGGVHRGFVRVFNNGDDPAFDWNMGGRLYSLGDDNYQRLSERERLKMTIHGEAVSETDVSASHLTILYAQHGLPLPRGKDGDAYSIESFPRDVVKAWVAVQLGKDKPLKRWPSKTKKEYQKHSGGRDLSKDFPVATVGKAVTEKFTLLNDWGTLPQTWATWPAPGFVDTRLS